MLEKLKKNKDAIIVASLSVIATATVAGVTYAVTRSYYNFRNEVSALNMSRIAHEAGVLDVLIAKQAEIQTFVK